MTNILEILFLEKSYRYLKIKNGSRIVTWGSYSLEIKVDKHFNWFQKKMIKWCFGFDVFDYKED